MVHRSIPGSYVTNTVKVISYAVLFSLPVLGSVIPIHLFSDVHAAGPTPGGYYSLNTVPACIQEGCTVSLVVYVTGASGNTLYQFRFLVRNPSGVTFQSQLKNYTTSLTQSQFTILVGYPSAALPGSTSLLGQYAASVDLVSPFTYPNAASSSFFINIVDFSDAKEPRL